MSDAKEVKKLLWIDLEMTGIDPKKQRIIEIGAIVTDFEFKEYGRYQSIIHQSDEVLAAAEDWPKQNMQKLFTQVSRSTNSEEQVVKEFLDFIHAHFFEQLAVIAGNSIHQDRRFIRQWWPNIEGHLHYRIFDVSTFKIWIEATKGKVFEKGDEHRALGDIEASIAEMKWSIEQLAT